MSTSFQEEFEPVSIFIRHLSVYEERNSLIIYVVRVELLVDNNILNMD